ncbi:hypothetical protein ACVW0Y_001202 [Pseudomonas sp. TE3786]
MKALDLLRCALVSLLFALIAPALTMQVSGPEEGDVVIDMSAISAEQLENATQEELQTMLATVPSKEIESSEESFLYPFTHPQIWYFYLTAVAHILPFIFLAAVSASFLNRKSAK